MPEETQVAQRPTMAMHAVIRQVDRERKVANAVLTDLQARLTDNRTKLDRLISELRATQDQVDLCTSIIPKAERDRSRADARLRELRTKMDRVERDLADEKRMQEYLEELERDDIEGERRLKEYVGEVLRRDAEGCGDYDSESEWSVLANSVDSLKQVAPASDKRPAPAAATPIASPSPVVVGPTVENVVGQPPSPPPKYTSDPTPQSPAPQATPPRGRQIVGSVGHEANRNTDSDSKEESPMEPIAAHKRSTTLTAKGVVEQAPRPHDAPTPPSRGPTPPPPPSKSMSKTPSSRVIPPPATPPSPPIPSYPSSTDNTLQSIAPAAPMTRTLPPQPQPTTATATPIPAPVPTVAPAATENKIKQVDEPVTSPSASTRRPTVDPVDLFIPPYNQAVRAESSRTATLRTSGSLGCTVSTFKPSEPHERIAVAYPAVPQRASVVSPVAVKSGVSTTPLTTCNVSSLKREESRSSTRRRPSPPELPDPAPAPPPTPSKRPAKQDSAVAAKESRSIDPAVPAPAPRPAASASVRSSASTSTSASAWYAHNNMTATAYLASFKPPSTSASATPSSPTTPDSSTPPISSSTVSTALPGKRVAPTLPTIPSVTPKSWSNAPAERSISPPERVNATTTSSSSATELKLKRLKGLRSHLSDLKDWAAEHERETATTSSRTGTGSGSITSQQGYSSISAIASSGSVKEKSSKHVPPPPKLHRPAPAYDDRRDAAVREVPVAALERLIVRDSSPMSRPGMPW